MSKKKDKKMTFGEAFKINLRSFKLLYDKMPSMYIAKIIGIVWSALTPYVGIYLSALLINELSGARDPKRLTTLVVLTLTSAALITLVSILFNKWKELKESTFWYKVYKMFLDCR